ncbi:universal stress protein [Cyclobacterium qasimii]|uniref:Universal stress protein family n=2 Tax=Cyclobacterium qasimii TaxID=1350429 RepID=S7X240_9BACT|nr:universal stress protein [Cyclobacterium qasimii]EPR70168.1 universal stress protein family [Cyclobacterium qasimii M12-11B]GEO22366.1 universal stress protein UspA [Cyclobacterium qasimii]
MKSILVPYDFSEEAEYAFELAQELATKAACKLKLIHIIEIPTSQNFNTMGEVSMGENFIDKIYMVDLVNKRKEQFKKLEEAHSGKAYKFSTSLSFGNPYAGISGEITEIEADLVIMGSKGSSGLEEILIGSNTEKVVRHSACPVITVKGQVSSDSIKKIVFASDFSENSKKVIKKLKVLQELLGAEIRLVKINTPNSFEKSVASMDKISAFIKANNLENAGIDIFNADSEEEGINEFADFIEADLIAMSTHGRTGFLHLLGGSIAEDVVNSSKKPVWTMKFKK